GQGDTTLTITGGQRVRAHFFLQYGWLVILLIICPPAAHGGAGAAGAVVGLVLVTDLAARGKSNSLVTMVN
ncbi:hypothetical protein, partial [Sodalis-like endosymbiont of Proechinophthirus fluctus]|uniref:hypothetical protein n=1 Tax=Sodalis-like endosymbiont of Proechinophthirus fluctus TaxID=1462730 RepID=UPI003F74D8BF